MYDSRLVFKFQCVMYINYFYCSIPDEKNLLIVNTSPQG